MIPKIFIHYRTFDALCKRAIEREEERDSTRGIVFSSHSKRMFVTKTYRVYAGNWYDVRSKISSDNGGTRVIGTPFTRRMAFKPHCKHLYNRGFSGDDVLLLDGSVLFEIEIVPDTVPEDLSGVMT